MYFHIFLKSVDTGGEPDGISRKPGAGSLKGDVNCVVKQPIAHGKLQRSANFFTSELVESPTIPLAYNWNAPNDIACAPKILTQWEVNMDCLLSGTLNAFVNACISAKENRKYYVSILFEKDIHSLYDGEFFLHTVFWCAVAYGVWMSNVLERILFFYWGRHYLHPKLQSI